MTMEIEKICRTCLGLNGPLLSIYDDAAQFSIADMLSKFARIKPKQKDNLPEKVCLSCISEINHCYSFMLKCENSNRTLRQLLPNALPEEETDNQIMTAKTEKKPISYSKAIQTIDKPLVYSKLIQTLDIIKSSKLVQTEQTVDIANNDEIILELNIPETTTTQYVLEDDEHEQKKEEGEESDPTYYEITRDCGEVGDEDEKYQPSEIYIHEEEENEDEEGNDRESIECKHLEFTLYSNVDGEAEILINRALNSERRKDQYQCSECIAPFVSEKNLKKHMLKRHGVNLPHDMDIIESDSQYEFIEEINETLENQRIARTNNAAKKAKLADDATADVKPIITKTSPKVFRFFCDRCNAGFARQKSLLFHRNLNACMKKTFECDECKRVFLTQQHIDEHKATHVLSDVCNLCNKLCESREELSQHMVEEHKRNIRNQCGICKKVFSMVSALKDHMRVHSGEKPYLCTICGKSFSQNANLQQHIRRHAQDKKFKCDDCEKSYVTKGELLSHKRSHTGDSPFKCDICLSSFTTSSSLLKHKRKHTGERPYACDLCPMRFAALNVMKNHRLTHTGEKPYKCRYCSKSFTQRGDCLIHLRTHTGERNHTCFCGEKFTHRSTLRAHLKTHGDIKQNNSETAEDSSEAEMIIGNLKIE